MTAIATKAARRKRCSECGELKDDVVGRQKLCSECESGMTYCKVCDEWTSREGDGCRHVQDGCGCNCGCGTWEIDAEAHKESFEVLLSKLAPLKDYWGKEPLVPAMLRFIRANNFWTFWHGPLIGGPPALAFKYQEDFGTHKSVLYLADIPASTQIGWGAKAIDAMQLGMSWLTSLDDKTFEANKITAKWIREFMRESAC